MNETEYTGQPRAKVGGEYGANGEWYEGGKFIATQAMPKKHGSRPRAKARKVQVSPTVWAECPEGMTSIYNLIVLIVDNAELRIGEPARVYSPYTFADSRCQIYVQNREHYDRLIAAYNAGERWEPLPDWSNG